jgi:phytoene/squalene synthetase
MADEAIRQADTVLSDPTPARSEGLLPHLIMTAIARNTLDELRADGFAVMQRRIALTPLRKLWIALMLRRRHRHRR